MRCGPVTRLIWQKAVHGENVGLGICGDLRDLKGGFYSIGVARPNELDCGNVEQLLT